MVAASRETVSVEGVPLRMGGCFASVVSTLCGVLGWYQIRTVVEIHKWVCACMGPVRDDMNRVFLIVGLLYFVFV